MSQLLIDTETRMVTIPGPPSLWVPPDLYTSAIELLIETAPHEGGPDFVERMLTALAQFAVDHAADAPPADATTYDILLGLISDIHHTGGLRGVPRRPDGRVEP
ncbi:MAG TPA: hypothetical protein VGE07_05990 [Herpetosiphonaceae bacterium]